MSVKGSSGTYGCVPKLGKISKMASYVTGKAKSKLSDSGPRALGFESIPEIMMFLDSSFAFPNIYTLWLFSIAMENGQFIDGLPIKNGDFPWLC